MLQPKTTSIYCKIVLFFSGMLLLPVADTFRTDVDADTVIDYAHCCIGLKREMIGVKYDLILAVFFVCFFAQKTSQYLA